MCCVAACGITVQYNWVWFNILPCFISFCLYSMLRFCYVLILIKEPSVSLLSLYPTLILQALEENQENRKQRCYPLSHTLAYIHVFIVYNDFFCILSLFVISLNSKMAIDCSKMAIVLTKGIWMDSLSRAKYNEKAAQLQMCDHSSETLLTDQYIPAQNGRCAIVRSTANANHPKKSSYFTANFRLWFCLESLSGIVLV